MEKEREDLRCGVVVFQRKERDPKQRAGSQGSLVWADGRGEGADGRVIRSGYWHKKECLQPDVARVERDRVGWEAGPNLDPRAKQKECGCFGSVFWGVDAKGVQRVEV